MSDLHHSDEDPEWSNFEQSISKSLNEDHNDVEVRFAQAVETQKQKLLEHFQVAAQHLATLYKDTSTNHDPAVWNSFRNAAIMLTAHHKVSLDSLRMSNELALELGSQRRTKEVVSWCSNKKKKNMRREELMGLLGNRSPPRRSPPPKNTSHFRSHNSRVHKGHLDNQSRHNRPRPILTSFYHTNAVSEGDQYVTGDKRSGDQLFSFFTEEATRSKRPLSNDHHPDDVTMDSPQHKRFKSS